MSQIRKEKLRKFRAGMRVSRLDHHMALGYVEALQRQQLEEVEYLLLLQDFRISYEDIMTSKAKELLGGFIALTWTQVVMN